MHATHGYPAKPAIVRRTKKAQTVRNQRREKKMFNFNTVGALMLNIATRQPGAPKAAGHRNKR